MGWCGLLIISGTLLVTTCKYCHMICLVYEYEFCVAATDVYACVTINLVEYVNSNCISIVSKQNIGDEFIFFIVMASRVDVHPLPLFGDDPVSDR